MFLLVIFIIQVSFSRPLRHFSSREAVDVLVSERNNTEVKKVEAESCTDAKVVEECLALKECWWCQERDNTTHGSCGGISRASNDSLVCQGPPLQTILCDPDVQRFSTSKYFSEFADENDSLASAPSSGEKGKCNVAKDGSPCVLCSLNKDDRRGHGCYKASASSLLETRGWKCAELGAASWSGPKLFGVAFVCLCLAFGFLAMIMYCFNYPRGFWDSFGDSGKSSTPYARQGKYQQIDFQA